MCVRCVWRVCACVCACVGVYVSVCARVSACVHSACVCAGVHGSVCMRPHVRVCVGGPGFLGPRAPGCRCRGERRPRTKRGGPAPAGPLCPPQLSRLRGGRPLPEALRGPAEPAGRPCTRRAGLAHHPRRSGKRPTLLSGQKGNSPWRSRARTACSVLIISPHGARSPSEPRGDPDAVGVRGSECAKQPAEHAPRRSPFPRPSSQRHLRPVGKLPVH